MKIDFFRIKDLGNHTYFESPMDAHVLILCGRNGSGKTNIIECFRSIFYGGSTPKLIRDGCNEGFAEFRLTSGVTFKKRLWRKKDGTGFGYELKAYDPEGGELPGGAKTILDSLLPEHCFDADWFIQQSPKGRVEFLLKHVKISFTGAEINATMKRPEPNPQVIAMTARAIAYIEELQRNKSIPAAQDKYDPEKGFTLLEFDAIYELQYSRRTQLNRVRDQLDGTIKTLSKGLSNAHEKDWSAERTRLETELREKESRIAGLKGKLLLDSEKAVNSRRSAATNEVAEIRKDISLYVGASIRFSDRVKMFGASSAIVPEKDSSEFLSLANGIAEGAATFIASVNRMATVKSELEAFEKTEAASLATTLSSELMPLESTRQSLAVDLSLARERAEQQQQQQGVRNTIAEQTEYLTALEAGELDLTHSIVELERLKTLKLRAIKIPGFNITYLKSEPRISIEGRDFDSLNFQSQLFFTFRFIMLANPNLSFIVCESANAIDADNIEALNRAAESADCQFVLEKCLADQPLRMIPARDYLLAEKAGEAITVQELEKL